MDKREYWVKRMHNKVDSIAKQLKLDFNTLAFNVDQLDIDKKQIVEEMNYALTSLKQIKTLIK